MKGSIPTGVLAQELGDRIAGRRVRTAVFTTFSFDPEFFELHVLPSLFDQPFRQVDKLKRIQLEDSLRDVDHLAVYFDQTALARDAGPACLDYRRIGIRLNKGVFHPKLVLLLLEDDRDPDHPQQALLVGVASANLTRGGWWENVECVHFEEISERDRGEGRVSWRRDLLGLLRAVQRSAAPGENHAALETIRSFLQRKTETGDFANASSDGAWHTRLFFGQSTLTDWLAERRLSKWQWNLEVVSPFFPPAGAGPLRALLEEFEPSETRIYLPEDPQSTEALVSRETYAAVEATGARWARLPADLVTRGRSTGSGQQPPRRVHAKTYRLWSKEGGDVWIIGSVNLTDAAHSKSNSGNLEAAWLIDVSNAGLPRRWWLDPLDAPKKSFFEQGTDEREGHDQPGLDLALRFDWGEERLSYRLCEDRARAISLSAASGLELLRFEARPTPDWATVPGAAGTTFADILRATTLLEASCGDLCWTVLVAEENLAHRPSLLDSLTPVEILEYWALLTPEQRAVFLEKRMDWSLEGLEPPKRAADEDSRSLFDGFAGIFHAFGCLERQARHALAEGRERDAATRLLGAKYDSLPNLLRKILEERRDDRGRFDPITGWVTFLCARQLWESIERDHPALAESNRKAATRLGQLLRDGGTLRKEVGLREPEDRAFLDWYERAFLTPAAGPGGAA